VSVENTTGEPRLPKTSLISLISIQPNWTR